MNGYEFKSERRRDSTLASMPLVLVSADAHNAEARTLGAVATIDKPVNEAALMSAVRGTGLVSSHLSCFSWDLH